MQSTCRICTEVLYIMSKRTTRSRLAVVKSENEAEIGETIQTQKKTKRANNAKKEPVDEIASYPDTMTLKPIENSDAIKKRKSLKKTDYKIEKTETEEKFLDNKTEQRKWSKFIGANVSIAGGLYKAILEADEIGARAIGMFLRSQRQWKAKPLEEETIKKFNETCEEYNFPKRMIVPHGSYLLNLGSPNEETRQKSIELFVDELQRCDRLDIPLYNFHPGSTCNKISRDECIRLIAEGINHAHKKSKLVTTVIENMSGQGGTIGGKFEEMRQIIDLIHDKSRVGVCLDTCHMFAAGYNIKTKEGYEDMKSQFDKIVGFQYLRAMHLNDSKGGVGCNLDRHEDIGKGKIGSEPFHWLVNDPVFDNLPMVLETPGVEAYKDAIKKLYSFVDKSST